MNKGKKVLIQEPLKRIPNPPQSYIELKVLTYNLNAEEKSEAMRGFYKSREYWKKEIGDYIRKLLFLRDHNTSNLLEWNDLPFKDEGYSPIEKIEYREMDNKKHGNTSWMILVDFNFYRSDNQLKMQKLYVPLKKGYYLKTQAKQLEEEAKP